MAKHYRRFIKGTNWALAGLLGLLGFGCSSNSESDDWDDIRLEYGTPSATYSIKGKVLEKGSNDPIRDVQVIVEFDRDNEWHNDTTYTDQQGEFKAARNVFPNKQSIRVISSDEKNNLFLPDTMDVSFKDVPFIGGSGSWYEGKAEREVTIHLEKNKKEKEPED